MKIQTLCGLFAATVLLCGCSTPKFTEYHGTEVIQGKGGAVRATDNIDIWENGDPDRKYKILGFVEESTGKRHGLGGFSRLFSGSGDKDSAMAKIAKKQGGDAVIVVSKEPEPSSDGTDDEDDAHPHRRIKKLVIIKYVD